MEAHQLVEGLLTGIVVIAGPLFVVYYLI